MNDKQSERIILGIDPGTTVTGYGLITVSGKSPSLITLGIIDLRKEQDHFRKIRIIFEETLGLIDRYHPDEFAVEAPFFGKNVQSMLKLGRAQGAAIAAALYRDLPVFEYAPRMIKMSITVRGRQARNRWHQCSEPSFHSKAGRWCWMPLTHRVRHLPLLPECKPAWQGNTGTGQIISGRTATGSNSNLPGRYLSCDRQYSAGSNLNRESDCKLLCSGKSHHADLHISNCLQCIYACLHG